MQKKIRNAQKQKVPFMLIAGDEDVGAARCRSATATARRRTACPSTRRSPRSSTAVRRPGAGLMRVRGGAARRCQVERAGDWRGRPDGFQRLWTPHRMAYIDGGQAEDADRGRLPVLHHPAAADADGLIVHRGEVAYVVLNLLPVQPRPPARLPLPPRRRLRRATRTRRTRSPR